jgi:hypothetical protein
MLREVHLHCAYIGCQRSPLFSYTLESDVVRQKSFQVGI